MHLAPLDRCVETVDPERTKGRRAPISSGPSRQGKSILFYDYLRKKDSRRVEVQVLRGLSLSIVKDAYPQQLSTSQVECGERVRHKLPAILKIHNKINGGRRG